MYPRSNYCAWMEAGERNGLMGQLAVFIDDARLKCANQNYVPQHEMQDNIHNLRKDRKRGVCLLDSPWIRVSDFTFEYIVYFKVVPLLE